MAGTAEDFQEIDRLLQPGSGISDEMRTHLLEARNQFQDNYLGGQAKAADDHTAEMDPQHDLLPQALSMAPATTHPEGDQAAEQDWKSGNGANGSVFVYDMPLQIAKKKLLEDPAVTQAMYPNLPPGSITPEEIARMDHGSDVYKTLNDYEWRKAADAAASAGKVAVRYSKAPWLHGSNASEVVNNLASKVKGAVQPYAEGVTSFVMGVDDTAAFGAGRAADEIANPSMPSPNEILGIESVGGVPSGDARSRNQMAVEEHPVLHALGQGVGMLAPWGATNKAYDFIAKGGEKLLGTAAKGIAPVAVSAASGALAGAGVQAGQEAVGMGARAAETGALPTGDDLSEAGERVKNAGLLSGGLGAGGELVGQAAGGAANAINQRFRGIPKKLSDAGVEMSPFRGPVLSPTTQSLVQAAEKEGVQAGDKLAQQIAPAIKTAAKEEVDSALATVSAKHKEVAASREGQMLIPAQNLVQESLNQLRKKHSAMPGGELKTLDVSGVTPKIKRIFNNQIADVSTTPVKGAIEMTPTEAEAYLGKDFQERLLGTRRAPGAGGPPGGPQQPFAKAKDAGGSVLTPQGQRNVQGAESTARGDMQGLGPSVVINDRMRPRGNEAIAPQQTRAVQGSMDKAPRGLLGPGRDEPNAVPGENDAPIVVAGVRGNSGTPGQPKSFRPENSVAAPTPVDSLGPVAEEGLPQLSDTRPSKSERAGRPTEMVPEREVGRGQQEALELDGLRDLKGPAQREAKRMAALAQDIDVQGRIDDGTLSSETLQKSRNYGREEITPARRKQTMDNLERSWTPAEKEAANDHVRARFYEVNDALRSGQPMTGEVKKNYDAMSGAFDKAVASGNVLPGRTLRGISVTPAELEQLKKAKTLTAQGFISQSNDPKVAKQFSEWGLSDERSVPVLFEIDQVSGVPVGKGQGELVHRPGTQYQVAGISEKDGVTTVHVQEKGYAPGRATEGIIGGGLLAINAATNKDKDEGEGAAAAAVGGIGLALALTRKGVDKVYVTPRRYNAMDHEQVINGMHGWKRDNKGAKEFVALDHAARLDRDQRTLNGQPGGWSALQGEHSKLIGAAKALEKLTSPKGEPFKVLAGHRKSKGGELLSVEALRAAADKGGVREQLEQLRNLDLLMKLRDAANPFSGRGISGNASGNRMPFGPSALTDAAAIRAYPVMRALGGPMSEIRGGRAGRLGGFVDDKKEETK